MSEYPVIGVVVIGRNEGERLGRCIESVSDQAPRIVYVDSGSTDGSRDLAASLGAEVIDLSPGPFTPAHGRQRGFEALMIDEQEPGLVQFIDGDCVMDPGWVEAARVALLKDDSICAVFGHRREEFPGDSLYNALIDIEWRDRGGDKEYFGGDVLMRSNDLAAAGGWPLESITGEDPELGFRLRKQGRRIVRLDREMTLHDARMLRFRQYWKRSVRSGHVYAEVGLRHKRGAGQTFLRRAGTIVTYGVLLPLLAIVLGFLWWPATIAVALLYARLLVVTAMWARARGGPWRLAVVYSLLGVPLKFAGSLGVLKYLLRRAGRGGATQALLVYKSETPVPVRSGDGERS